MGAVPALEAVALTKSFGALRAVDGVSIQFFPGEIHAVLGENGAGKTTLMRLLTGELRPDSGEVRFPAGPAAIAMVHQHFMLVPALTVAENFALAAPSPSAWLDVRRRAAPALALAERFGWEIDPDALVRDLSVGVTQRVEILKALAHGAPIALFDEPTATLTTEEVEDLFGALRQLRDAGHAIVLIAHKLSETLSIADRVTALRGGKWVATALRSEVDADQLAEWMIGERVPEPLNIEPVSADVSIRIHDLSARGDRGQPAVKNFSLELKAGEIVGIGGVDGNGQAELAEALVGIRERSGTVLTARGEPPRAAYIPQDRRRDGLATNLSLVENFALGGYRYPLFRRGPFVRWGPLRDWAAQLAKKFDVRASSIDAAAASLSGGNQQKVVVARELEGRPDFIVAMNPTRGLDVKSTRFVRQTLVERARDGIPIALISTDLDELKEVCHRLVFMSRGALVEGASGVAYLGGDH